MRTAGLYLWKEWREQRAACAALAVALPVLVAVIATMLPAAQVASWMFAGWCAALSLVLCLIAVGGELLGREDDAARTWLERLPRGLPGAFGAKLAMLVLSSVGALLYGLVIGRVASLVRGVAPADVDGDAVRWLCAGLTPMAAIAAFWTFAASAWCGRGMLALCCAALLLALPVGGAVYLVGVGYRPPDLELALGVVSLVAAGCVASAVGYLRGRRFAGGALGAGWRGCAAGVLCLLPEGSVVAGRTLDFLRPDFDSDTFDVEKGWVFDDGRKALLEFTWLPEHWNHERRRVLEIDLESGEWATIGEWTAELVFLWNSSELLAEPDFVLVRNSEDWTIFEAESGRTCDWNGKRWRDSLAAAGHGWMEFFPLPSRLHDPYRGTDIPLSDLPSPRRGSWVGPDVVLHRDEHWNWYEQRPGGEPVRADWLEDAFEVGPMLADGRLLVTLHGGSEDRPIALIDPLRRSIRTIGSTRVDWLIDDWPLSPYGRTFYRPGEPVLLDTPEGRFLLNDEGTELLPADESWSGRILRRFDDGTMILAGREGIVRRDPESGQREVLFPMGTGETEVLQ